ncbi:MULTISPECIES: hypothetical protein [Chryseobacterium]|jgi:hypothetical protein|uniref:Replication initiator protein n=1 Tax=Chryseobacterium geocarposphaerae TaxID=1416776 RepID=A0ABU1L992_9FLAO|nr:MULTISPECIES: hypothetical protein [Chryseobacterium]MDR6403277.1 hypothetical protein [Chryseobacterium geocarposphaerae]MDR6696831.1 hypothetical protein [Chryseobacterium ginsenosidimutans]
MPTDFVKIQYTDKNYELPTDKTDFTISVNNETGETDNKKEGEYFGMQIIKYASGRMMVKGSIHKFFNRTDFNGNDFDMINLFSALQDLETELGLKPESCRLENIEIGVNIQLSFDPNRLLQNLLFHRSAEFNKTISGSFYYQSAKRDYIIKIYNKTAQYEKKLKKYSENVNFMKPDEKKEFSIFKKTVNGHLQPNTLRFEIKFLKMNVLNDLDIVFLSDLKKPEMMDLFKNLLLKEFQEVYFYDYTIDETKMKLPEINKLKDYRNPNYWVNLSKKDKYYHKKRFEKMTLKYSQNLKGKVSELIKQKIVKLTEKSLDFSTDNCNKNEKQKFRLFDRSDIGSKSPNQSSQNLRL